MILTNLKRNWKSGLTVALVSIPLSVSLAVASNAAPAIGIITAVWAGLIAALFGGSNFNITGPTGALSGVVATYVLIHGMGGLAPLAVAAGIMIIAAYVFRLERYLILIPSSVIHGFTLGVAFIIGLNQLNSIFGLAGLPSHERFFSNVIESLQHLPEASGATLIIFACSMAILFACQRWTPRIPGAVLLAPLGIGLGYLATTGVIALKLPTLASAFGNITFKVFNATEWVFSVAMVQTAAVVALIAILETMLAARIADGMTKTKHNERREMLGLGLANVASGLAGGMPATAALARTALNIKTGADHRTAAVTNVVWLALISILFLRYFTYLPMSVIAAILVFVAIQMVEREHFMKFWQHERSGFVVALLVAAITILEDPMIGILFGVAVSLLLFVNRIARGHFALKLNTFNDGIVETMAGEKLKEIEEDADVLLYSIRGKLCYINSRAHIARFETNLVKYKHIILRLREVYFIDIDGVEALDEIIEMIEARGQQVLLTSVDPNVLSFLERASKNYHRLKTKGRVFPKTEAALQHLGIAPR